MGMGKIVKLDDRGRITLPAEIRRLIRAEKFRVEVKDDTIVLEPVRDRGENLVKIFEEIKLVGAPDRVGIDASEAKHIVGGAKE